MFNYFIAKFYSQDNNIFETIFDKTYKWVADSKGELIRFVKCLYTVSYCILCLKSIV